MRGERVGKGFSECIRRRRSSPDLRSRRQWTTKEGSALPIHLGTCMGQRQTPLKGFYDPKDFVLSIQKPRIEVILIRAMDPVDQTILTLIEYIEPDDCSVDGGNAWYENTGWRAKEAVEKNWLYLGMGVSRGEEEARNDPSLMLDGTLEAYREEKERMVRVSQSEYGADVALRIRDLGISGQRRKGAHYQYRRSEAAHTDNAKLLIV